MSIPEGISALFIGPLSLFFEVIYSFVDRFFNNPGVSIVFLSLAMNFLVLPLYRRADSMQKEQREEEKKLERWVTHIKKTFSGDERFMMLQTYYRQNDYTPLNALKGSVSLLLEIPFFIVAYKFLSNLAALSGVGFGPIADLSLPDNLIRIGRVSINALPILMTAINILSAAVYMKGFPLKSKLQMYGMSLIFLVLLYTSPAGLVFYWTMNNVFSLLKNIFYKLSDPGKILRICASCLGIALFLLGLFAHLPSRKTEVFVFALALALQLPMIISRLKLSFGHAFDALPSSSALFFISALCLSIFTGALIPSAVISASPIEFVNYLDYFSPLNYILNSLLLSLGTFVVWFGIFYWISDEQKRKLFSFGMVFLSVTAVTDYLFFGTKYGLISSTLKYDIDPSFLASDKIINILVIVLLLLALFFIYRKSIGAVRVMCVSLVLAASGISCINAAKINNELTPVMASISSDNADVFNQPEITLSKDEPNVVIIMLDRALGGFVPFIFEERPELVEKFDGFTYYSNTLSFSTNTISASSSLFGGYEYTPESMNDRDSELLVDKHNEALRVLPTLFDESGYAVTVCDPPMAGYCWLPDLSIYNDLENVKAYVTKNKFLSVDLNPELQKRTKLKRDLFCYGLFRISPVFLQPAIYNNGLYNTTDVINSSCTAQVNDGLSTAYGTYPELADSYKILESMSDFTNIVNSDSGCFLMMSNDLTHSPGILQTPDYTLEMAVDNTDYDSLHYVRHSPDGRTLIMDDTFFLGHYNSNMASMILLGNWFDYLRENGVYDNTRIIIAADHGYDGFDGCEQLISEEGAPKESSAFRSLLMVKDFNSTGFTANSDLMTNADVPLLAADSLVDAINPFTGNSLDGRSNKDSQLRLVYSVGDDTSSTEFNIIKSFLYTPDAPAGERWVSER